MGSLMGSQMNSKEIWAEMARRKVRFHNSEEWDTIKLWGLFAWGVIKKQRDSGELLCTGYRRENRIVWCFPSVAAWQTKIEPLIEKHTLEELTRLAGWK